MSEDPLLKPYQIKNLEIRNRLMTSAHEPSYAENGYQKINIDIIMLREPKVVWD